MNTDHLSYLFEICRCGSINKAAKSLFVSQSHLSGIIKSIEAEIGYLIFVRGASGILLTPEGEMFMAHAQNIIIESRNIKMVPTAFEENRNLSVVSAPVTFLAQCFFEFKRKTSDQPTQDTFIESSMKESIRMIVERKCRIGFLVLFEQNIDKYVAIANSYNLSLKKLKGGIPMVVFMSLRHPLAKKDKISTADILGYPFVRDAQVDYEDTPDALHIIDKCKLLYISGRGVCMDAVRKGMYLSIGISIPDNDSALYQCVCKPVTDVPERMAIAVLKQESYSLSNRERGLVDYLVTKAEKSYP